MTVEISRSNRIRAALTQYRRTNQHGGYPSELRSSAAQYSRARRQAGASVAQIAAELGVSKLTARRWAIEELKYSGHPPTTKHELAAGLSLIPMVVRPQVSTDRPLRLEVELSDGTRVTVSGLSGQDLADTIDLFRRIR